MDSTTPFSNKVEEKLVRPTRNTGKIFSLQEKAHFVVLLRSCIPGHTLLLRCPKKAEAPRDIGICTLVYRIDVQTEINVQVGKFLKNIKRAGQNRRAEGKIFSKSINVQTKIRPCRGNFFSKFTFE